MSNNFKCENCGGWNFSDDGKLCSQCGEQTTEEIIRCENCKKATNHKRWRKVVCCLECGKIKQLNEGEE